MLLAICIFVGILNFSIYSTFIGDNYISCAWYLLLVSRFLQSSEQKSIRKVASERF